MLGSLDVEGCLVRYNPPTVKLGLGYVFECTVEGSVSNVGDVERLAGEALSALSAVVGPGLEPAGGVGWEYIGRMFNLYSYKLSVGGVEAGVLRVVEVGGAPLGVFGALRPGLESLLPGLEGVWLAGEVEYGRPLKGPVYLREAHDEAAGQGWGRFVVYAVEGLPPGPPRGLKLRVTGAVRRETAYSLEWLRRAASSIVRDFHCVTGWSVRDVEWHGVPVRALLEEAGLGVESGWVIFRSWTGYTSVVPLEDALRGFVAVGMGGGPLPLEHGGPLRAVIPHLYGWKSAKWLEEIRVEESYFDGYWEALAYHERGRTAALERFKVRNRAVAEEGIPAERARPLPPRG